MTPGSELNVTEDDRGIRLVKVGRRLVARPRVAADRRPSIDVARIVEEERNRWP